MNSEMQDGPRFTWRHWSMVMVGIIVLIFVGVILHFAWPYMGWWAPIILGSLGATVTIGIPTAVIGLGLHFWQENRRKNHTNSLAKPTPENQYPAKWHNGQWVKPEPGPLPMKVSQNYSPTIRNDVNEWIKAWEYARQQPVVVSEVEQKALPSPSTSLQLGNNFSIPADDVLSGRGLIFGTSGSGKSVTVADVTEELGRLEVPLLLADTEGEYEPLASREYLPYGLLAGADGAVRVNGDDEAADFGIALIEQHLQAVLDLSSYPSEDAAAQVLVGIIAGVKAWEDAHDLSECVPFTFILDEAKVWLPQQQQQSRLSREVLRQVQAAFFTDLASRGRKRGMGLVLATQRPAELDKQAMKHTWRILHRQTEAVDIQCYKEMGVTADDIAFLKDGEAIVSAPRIRNARVQMRMRRSPHGANTPGLASVQKHLRNASETTRNFGRNPLEIRQVSNGAESAFDKPDELLQGNISKFRPPSAQAQRTTYREIPEMIRKEIEERYVDGMLRTKIHEALDLNDDQYHWVKTVCDEYDSKKREAQG